MSSRGLVLIVLALGFLGEPAWAKMRVAVLPVQGAKGDEVEELLGQVLGSRYAAISARAVRKARARLRIRKSSPAALALIAKEIQVEALIAGSVKHKNLSFTIHEGKSGRVLATVSIAWPLGRGSEDELTTKLLPALDAALASRGDEGTLPHDGDGKSIAEDSSFGGDGKRMRRGTDERSGPARPRARAVSEGDALPGAAQEGDERNGARGAAEEDERRAEGDERNGARGAAEEDERRAEGDERNGARGAAEEYGRRAEGDERNGARGAAEGDEGPIARDRLHGLLDLGVSFTSRSLNFSYDPTVTSTPWSYHGQYAAGAFIVGEVYPLAFLSDGAVAGIGLGFAFDRVFKLASQLQSDGESFPTTEQRISGGLRYRWHLGAAAFVLAVGVNKLTFAIDTGTTEIDLPDVGYTYSDAGLRAILPVVNQALFLYADGRYLAVLSAGEIETDDNYGAATMNGVDLEGGIEVRPFGNITLKAGVRYLRIGYTFAGTGAKATLRDDSPDVDVGGALDEYLGGYVTAGYVF